MAPKQCCLVSKGRTSLSLVSSSIVVEVVSERGEVLTYHMCDGPRRGHLLLEAWSKPGENAGLEFHRDTERRRVEGPCRGLESSLLLKAGLAPKVRLIRASGVRSDLETLQGWRSHHYGSCRRCTIHLEKVTFLMCIKVSLVAPVPIVSCPFAMHCCVSLLHNPSLSSGKLSSPGWWVSAELSAPKVPGDSMGSVLGQGPCPEGLQLVLHPC